MPGGAKVLVDQALADLSDGIFKVGDVTTSIEATKAMWGHIRAKKLQLTAEQAAGKPIVTYPSKEELAETDRKGKKAKK